MLYFGGFRPVVTSAAPSSVNTSVTSQLIILQIWLCCTSCDTFFLRVFNGHQCLFYLCISVLYAMRNKSIMLKILKVRKGGKR